MKSFAREVVTPTLLDMCATTTSSAPELYFATFGISLQVLCRFACHYSSGSPVPLQSPMQGSCRLYAVRCVPGNQVSGTLCLSRSLPSRFYHSKSYFRHLNNGSLALNSPAHTIRILVVLPIISIVDDRIRFDLVAQYHRMNNSTTRRFGKYA